MGLVKESGKALWFMGVVGGVVLLTAVGVGLIAVNVVKNHMFPSDEDETD